jgi:exportin-2 (importin alpha re-exporter)
LFGGFQVGLSQSHDKLAITSIKFLTTVAKSVHHELFNQAEVVQQICEKIVVPNLRMRDDDEELFEMNHVEYIRR